MLAQNSVRSRAMGSGTPGLDAGVERFEITVGIERSHAAGASGSHRLAVYVIGYVAGGEYPRHAGRRRIPIESALHRDVAATHDELPLEQRGVRRVADGDEQ